MTGPTVTAVAPGRVNLIGDHTDHTGGLVLPMAVDRATTVTGTPGGEYVELWSETERRPAVVRIDTTDPSTFEPAWARYVAGVVAEVRPTVGFIGQVTTTLPIGAGLSSSAALEVAVALALGATGPALDLAARCQRAEQRASGVPCGIMDQLASAAGVAGHALLIDCHSLDVRPVPLPEHVDVVVIDSGERRRLAGSAYAERRAECETAERTIGPLRLASTADVGRIADRRVRRRAAHVVSENQRVREAATALEAGDVRTFGALMVASHRSLRDDFEVSTPGLDAMVDRLLGRPGVHGARLTGAGFGGCVVALAEQGSLAEGFIVEPAQGARLVHS